MNAKKTQHESKAPTKAIIYQLCVAIKACYEMRKNQIVYIEEFGDVSNPDASNYEVKQFSDNLTDNHLSLWKTIKNWLYIDCSSYKRLVIYTTQDFSSDSTIKNWNNSTNNQKYELLKAIYEKQKNNFASKVSKAKESSTVVPSEVYKIQQIVFNGENESKLFSIIEKIDIAAASGDMEELYQELKETRITGVLEGKKDDFLQNLIGYISQANKNKNHCWEITYSDFHKKIQELTETYCSNTKIFPEKYINDTPKEVEVDEKKKYLFVEKINDIEFQEKAREAIISYINYIKTIKNEFSSYEIPPNRIKKYIEENIQSFEIKYELQCINSTCSVQESKSFFLEIIGSEPSKMEGYDVVPKKFRNGLIHSELNDPSRKLKWRLEHNE